ncbi:MAG: hypothetical protein ACRCZF_20135, partial [Gemmataceae bacterium]
MAKALALWKQNATTDPGFWRQHRDGFRTPAAFAQVIEALIGHRDYRAGMALLMTWLSEADDQSGFQDAEVPLTDPSGSFVLTAFEWLAKLVDDSTIPVVERTSIIHRFFELLEANAGDRWHVPDLGADRLNRIPSENESNLSNDADEDGTYPERAYRDSADDGNDGSIADESPASGPGTSRNSDEFPLDDDADSLEDRFEFLATVAKLWRCAARPNLWPATDPLASSIIQEWQQTAERQWTDLRRLIHQLHAIAIPAPTANLESIMEYDRRRVTKGRLLDLAVTTAVETLTAARSLASLRYNRPQLAAAPSQPPPTISKTASVVLFSETWEDQAVALEAAIARNDAAAARRQLVGFVALFGQEPLLVHPPADGGAPAPALRAQLALEFMRSLLARLPRLGLLRETHQLIRLTRAMERNDPPEGKRVSSFDQLFRTALLGVTESLVTAANASEAASGGPLGLALRQVADSFHTLWVDHSQTLRLSVLESVVADDAWSSLKSFIRTYGSDLFTVRFLTLSNIRGILSQGASHWMQRQLEAEATRRAEEPTPKLVEDWIAGTVDTAAATRNLEVVLQALVEHYDEYRDYKTTTTQSDYGEDLYILLDFLRLKVAYERFAWRLRPLTLAHDVLCRRGREALAADWRTFLAGKTRQVAEELLAKLAQREAEHGLRLRTVRDRLEERFVLPLAVDQAAACVRPAMAAANEPERTVAFTALRDAIHPLADAPTGVGLDVPVWL